MNRWSRFRDIKAALDTEDIEGLLALDCPADEYNGEASLIESELAKATNFGESSIGAKELEEIVARVWNDRFGPFQPEDLEKRRLGFSSVARKIAALR